MKIRKKLLLLFTLLLLSLALPMTASAAVKISKKTVTLDRGKSTSLKITGTKSKVTWKSSNKKVASVSSKGKVTAKSAGTAVITATVKKKKYTCRVTVRKVSEAAMRKKLIKTAAAYLGTEEGSSRHHEIVNLYNSCRPLPRCYYVKYTDAWCATFVSAVAMKCGMTNIIPQECGCGEMVYLFQRMGAWQEDDAYRPKTGDIIFYDWHDSGMGDNRNWPDHVGIVESVKGNKITVIEGNMSQKAVYEPISESSSGSTSVSGSSSIISGSTQETAGTAASQSGTQTSDNTSASDSAQNTVTKKLVKKPDIVGRRTITVNSRYIRGYGIPNY